MAAPSAAYAAEDDSSGFDPLGAIANALGLSDDGVETYAVEGANTVVDPDTTNAWNTIATSSNSTENIGRIWTDKSVFSDDYDFEGTLGGTSVVKGDDSDFLVGLSAISSTSNLKSVVTNITPLDIVLVLDVSGSMDDPIGEIETTTYQEVYDGRYSGLNTWRTYYVRSGNDYIAVTWESNYYNGSWQDREGNEYEPRTSRNDNNRNHVQFYQQITASESAGSKMQALKDAANGFAETFATMNDSIADPNDRHRISIVKFASNENDSVGNGTYWDDYYDYRPNYTQVVSDLDSYTTENVSAFTNTINSLEGEGATQANYGFHQAQRVFEGDGSLTGARPDAQKVVIFFTDGNPTNYQNFSNSIAGQAINYAYNMKQAGALVYTIGVFEDANPSDTNSNFNRYMNAVSSNYPEAQCTNWRGDQMNDFGELNLGDRAEGEDGEEAPQYYYSATNAVGLEQVFKDIIESFPINQGSGSPIEEVEGAAGTPGYLTFTDTLGSFMEVTGVGADNNKMYLAFADGLHEGTTSDGGKTWTFSGVVNEDSEDHGVNTAYPEGANLSEIKVTVTKGDDLETGDTITVQIPASLIPMRNYDVDTDNATMTVSDTYPVRLFYGVSVKDAAIDALNNPQNANHDAVLAQTSADGKTIDFYSNSFVKDAAEGSTEASFTPSDGNKFYYYPVNTQLFIDKNCTQPATRSNIGNYSTLYYQDSYWKLTGNGNVAEEVPANGSITRSGNDWNVTYQNGNAYIEADTPRADRPGTLVSNKGENVTGTASTVLTPTWVGNSVSQKLGNNGKLSVDAPGDLRIDKNVDWGNASNDTQADKNSFKFTVRLYTVAEDGTQTNLTNQYDYAVYATGETPVSEGTVSDNGEITLVGGQYVVISDLPNGAQYTVTEQAANQNGFTTTDNSTGENAKTDDGIVEGTIVGGNQQTASFTNTYHATEVTLEGANQLVKVQKNLTGREWQDTDEFRFTMLPEGTSPAPVSTEAVVDDEDAAADYTVNLSNITFENPGKFTYVIEEDNDTNTIAGIDYSNETYAVTITVVDNGTGKLDIQSVQFTQRTDVDGNTPAEQPQITDNTVVFTNNYDADEATTNLNGTKDYTDNSGANPNAANKFTFELKAIGGYATNGGSAQNPTIEAADVPMPEGADADTHTITIGNNGTNPDGFAFQTIRYNGTHLNNTYIYEIREVIPQGAADNGDGTWSLNGMTYDGTVHTVTVGITDETNEQGEGMHIVATPSMQPADVKFTNVYDPTDYTLEGDEAIHGTKVLQGREIGDDETFYFELKQTDGPETVLADPEVKTVTKNSGMDFALDELTFSKAGEYTFTVNEVADDQGTETTDGSGMTYSQNVAKVTIKVKDGGNGALVLDGPVVYENQGSDETGKAVFTNVYEAELKYGAEGAGGINVTKQLLDRPMSAGEFNFTITGEGDAAGLTADADKNFQNTGAAADQTITMAKLQSLTFDETDAGKTYTFIVDETEPAEGQGLAGVTYDKSQYKVEIEVVDNGDGSMHAVTTVTQTMDKDGNEIADGGKVVVDHANSDDVGYAVPTFGFVNDYNPNPVDMGGDADNALQVTKKVTGAPSAADYTFTLTAQNTAEGPVANIEGLDENHQTTETTSGTIEAGGTQTLTFDTLTFTEPGTYTFTVQENQPAADEGWTFDTDPRTITVEVTDVNPAYEPGGDAPQYDGNLYIGEVTGNNPTIENKYDHGTVTIGGDAEEALTVDKTVKGWSTDADFNFTFVPVEEEGVDWKTVQIAEGADKTAVTENFTDGDMHSAQFGEITFTEPGTYKFNVTEDEAHDETADPAGWTYDDSTQIITVTVSETDADGNYDGKLHAAVSGPAKFENTYKAGTATVEGGEATFAGTKTINGRDWHDNETFGFELTKGDVSEGASWNNVTYLAADAAEGTEATAFESAEATANAGGNGKFWFAGKYLFSEIGTYTFNVTETQHNDAGLPEKDAEPVNGMTYDRHVGTITVEVTDNGSGTLQTNVTYGDVADGADENDMTFENAYEPTPVVYGDDTAEILGGNKNVDDNSGSYVMADDQFTFMMRAQNAGNPMPEGLTPTYDEDGRPIVSVTNKNTNTQNNTATFDFGQIKFTKAGTYQYNVYENETNMPAGVSPQNSGRTYTITFVVVEDQTTGTLSVEASAVLIGAGDQENTEVGLDEINFTNVYNATATSGSTQIFKTMSGRNWQQGDTFTFDVAMTVDGVAADEMPTFNFDNIGATVKDFTSEAGKLSYNITITPSTSETGNTYAFSTGTATYTHEGTYIYTITERDVDPSIVNVTKDPKTYTVTVTVTNVNNVLQRKVDINPATESGRVDFTNTFVPTAFEDVPEGFGFTKEFTGHEWTEDYSFNFVLKAVDGAPMPADAVDGEKIVTVNSPDEENGTTAAFNFGDIKYEKAGTYEYTVNEIMPLEGEEGYNAGITYDNHVANVTVTVTEDEDENGNKTGTLSAKAAITAEDDETPAVFTNTYDTDDVTIGGDDSTGIAVQKTLAGRDWEAGDRFDFQIEAVTEDAPTPEETTITGLGNTSGSDAVVAYFGDITFTKEMLNGASTKEFKYTVSETSVSADGVTVDPSTERTVTVTVTDDGKGTLTATVNHDNSSATTDADKQVTNAAAFTNTYDASSTEDTVPAGFELTKEFTGHEWTADYVFEFVMSPVSGTLADGTEAEEIPMPNADDNAGVTIDDGGNAHKTISGPQEGTTANFDFGTITYDKAGTYVYEVKEAKAGTTEKGVTYTANVAKITVTVTDKDTSGASTGKLVATASIEGETFTNTYEANADYDADGAGGLDITKKLNNRNMTAGQFTFTIEATDDNAEKAAKKLGLADGETSTTVKNNEGAAGAAVSVVGNPFEKMTFDETDDGVTYTYTIKEEGKSGEDDYAGYTLDDTTYTVKITATDEGDGTMTVTTVVNDGTADKEYTGERATVAFENTYDAGDVTVGGSGEAQIVANKTLKNDDIANYAGEFNFQVTSGNVVVTEGINDKNGNVTFDTITYTTENLAAAATADGSKEVGKANLDTTGEADVYTFDYSVSEVTTGLPGGVTYDDGNTNVTVTVTDDRHGKLSVEVSYTGDATSVEFVNTYGAGKDGTAELNLKGNKEIVPGKGLTEVPALVDDTYTFEITGKAASDGTPAPMPEKTTATNKSGAVEFGPITFSMENVFGTTASTTTDESEATQETETVEEVTTTEETEVTEGTESEETTTEEPADSATAENGEESVVDESATDESSTEEASSDEATADESSKSAKSEKTAAAGVTSSDEGVSTQTAGRTKTFTYTIKETNGSVPGVDNDTTVKTVTVTVTDEGNGKISVSKKEAEGADTGNDFTFTNVYNVDPEDSSLTGDGGFTITKTLTGRAMAEEEFAFKLKDQNSNWWTAPTNPAAADGEAAEISFGDVHFTKPGTYTYTLEEEQGNLGGVEYDTNKYTVIATVTDKDADGNYTGELEVTWQINGAADNTVAFKNTYTAQPATVSLGAGKLMKGRDLSAGEYTFKLSDANGNEVSTATNEENGAVTFDTITYDQAGEYTYTITEVTPEDTDPNTEGVQNNGVTYDQTVYNVTVKVTDNGKGQLVPTISYGTEDGGAPVFTNTYTAPAEPEQGGEGDGDGGLFGMAKTGDFTGGIMAVLAAVVAAAAAGATYAIRKMRRPRGRHAR